jgi:putative ABC transport system permease protein
MASLYRDIPERMKNWGWSQFHTYVKLVPGADAATLENKLPEFAKQHSDAVTTGMGSHYVPHLMSLRNIHLYASDQVYDIAQRGNIQTVYILGATALFILIIAILNFVNLSTARAIGRVKEVGVRKVIGAVRTQLIYQFLSESMIVSFTALLIAVVIAQLVLPSLNSFSGKSIAGNIFIDPMVIAIMFGLTFLIGLTAGSYPAFYLSAFRPAQILSNRQTGGGKMVLRKTLVTVQFVLSFVLITAVLVISGQHEFLRTADMGFNKDNLIVLPLRDNMRQNAQAVKNALSNHPGIISATMEYGLPGEAYAGDGIRDDATKKEWPIALLMVDHDYVKTMSLHLVAGRDFSKDRPSDENDAFIISESATKMLGYQNPDDALGHRVSWPRWDDPQKIKEGTVIGVIRDFHLNSLKENMGPVALQIYPEAYESIALKISGEDIPATIEHLRRTWAQLNSEWPFEYRFIDDNFDKLYKSEERLSVLFTVFSILTVFVAALGLFGLVVYNTSQRYKEISIRKVLGAKEISIIIHLIRNYLVIIGVAFIIAIPLSYFAIQSWLMRFPFRIDIGPWLFIKAACFILVLAVFTVGIQSLKAARTNPVNALKEQ